MINLINQFINKAKTLSDSQKKIILDNNKKIAQWLSKHPNDSITEDKVEEILSEEINPPLLEIPKKETEISELEKDAYEIKQETTLVTRPPSPTRSMFGDAEFIGEIEKAFVQEIDDFYGKKGLFGFTKGVDTKEWKFVKELPALKLIEYYTGDSTQSILNPEIKNILTNSPKHQNFLKQIATMIEETKGAVKPYENENMETFLKRLGGFILKNSVEEQK